MLEAATGLPVNVENAANACALGEVWFGRHDEHLRHLVAVTVSEGIGVGVLLNGQLVHGANAMAGEFGHMTLDENGSTVLLRQARMLGAIRLEFCGRRLLRERQRGRSAGNRRRRLRFEDILRLAETGDRRAVETLERMAHVSRRGARDDRDGLAPQVIVVIGEVTSAWDRVGPIVAEVLERRALRETPTRIIPTDHTTQPRLRGAVTLVVQQHFGVPNVA